MSHRNKDELYAFNPSRLFVNFSSHLHFSHLTKHPWLSQILQTLELQGWHLKNPDDERNIWLQVLQMSVSSTGASGANS
jgi:hypothetical protein